MTLLDRRLILVLGKGGVGRSTMAAAIAAACARRGRKTLLYQSNAKDRYGDYFGKPTLGPEPTELAPNLYGLNTSPAHALHEYGLMILKFERIYDMIFENRVTKAFLRAIPGLDDYAILGKAWYHTTQERKGRPVWDTVVFDMPASGHSMSMLRIPWVITETVPEGPLTRDARTVQGLLRDPARTAAILVTIAEEMPVTEARDLASKIAPLGIIPQRVLVNQMFPDHFPAGSPSARVLAALSTAQPDEPLASLTAHGCMARSRRALNEHYFAEVAATVPAPAHPIPYLSRPALGPADIQQLSQIVEKALTAPAVPNNTAPPAAASAPPAAPSAGA
ncbi:MAG TPA: ArsA family ATPase [Kofleriaceae bacterium]|nr:ArsA family ATPase [Kofleriaceae bacterium]